ncbi:hypothetical protein SAMN03080601_03048 [Alkalitalea saponilacus]|uniref:Uncharacterized protein n=2 Tax=Alkalitalea saponilacus TaxID=889453 RepID=A0A1T5HSV1_9BACT|nr:hypothetical protein [Alkalitalea saponilacus]SKC23763.1 hypothetical protein SAMN03080601_03048 [Alkalitalea saponilacus]
MTSVEGGWYASFACSAAFGTYGALTGYGVALTFGGPVGLDFAVVYGLGTSYACARLTGGRE